MKIGNISFNPEAFKDYTKEQFFSEYAGKLIIDKEQVWAKIQEANKQSITEQPTIKESENESINNISEPGKKSKRGRTDEGTQSGS